MKVKILSSTSSAVADESAKPSYTGLHATRNHIPLISRILLSALFLMSSANKILHPIATQEYMAAHGMPLTGLFMIAAVVLQIGGGLSLLLGFYARLGAAVLATFTLITAFIFHRNFADQIQQIMFMKNLSIIGGLLMMVQHGPGNIALHLGQRRF